MSTTNDTKLEPIDRDVYLHIFDVFASDAREVAKTVLADDVHGKTMKTKIKKAHESYDRLIAADLCAPLYNVNGEARHRDDYAMQAYETYDSISRDEAVAKIDALLTPTELPEFKRDEYAEALATINDAVLAFRNAAKATAVLGVAAELHDIEPFREIEKNFRAVQYDTPAFSDLETLAETAATYYPTNTNTDA